MRNKILGAVGILWGGFMTFRWLAGGTAHTAPLGDAVYSSGYMAGQWGAHIFGIALLLTGIYSFFKKAKPTS